MGRISDVPKLETQTPPAPPVLVPVDRLPPLEMPTIKSVTIVVAKPPALHRPFRAWLARNRTVVLFLAFLFVTDHVVGLFAGTWSRHSPDEYAARVEGCRSRTRDIVYLGGSPVAEGIDPDLIAANGYNLGLSGGTTSDFYFAAIRASPTPPRMLVYGITASDINDSRHEPHGPYSLMSWGDLLEWNRLRPEAGEWVTRHFLQSRFSKASNLYQHRHGIRMWLASEAEEQIPGCCSEAAREEVELRDQAETLRNGNGYWPARGYAVGHYDRVKASGAPQAPFAFLDRYRTGSHLKFLHRLMDWSEEHGVKLVLVDMPVTADLETRFDKEFAEYRQRLLEIERERGATVLRPSRAVLGLTDTHFADVIHMNREGAQLFSDWLKAHLEVLARMANARDRQ